MHDRAAALQLGSEHAMTATSLEIVLKLDGIEGESTMRAHEKETVVLSYEQAIDLQTGPIGGGGGGAGKSTFSGVRFRKPIDKGSVPLLLACASGLHIKDARFTFRRSGSMDFYKVTLEDVLVKHISQQAGTGPQYPLSFDDLTAGAESTGVLDQVTLEFARILWEYRPIGPDGVPGPPVKGGWNLTLNKNI
jgi:type VI secretion system secreted protein Hcp